jgi:HK97 family phage major capsid protein
MMTMSDLDAFRSVEEYATYQTAVRARIQEIDAQHSGQPFKDEVTRSEWADLGDIDTEINNRVLELNARLKRITDLSKNAGSVERSEEPRERAGTSFRSDHVPEDIFALEQYRSLSRSDEEMGQALRDGAMKAIDRAIYPHERADQDATRADLQKLFTTVDDPTKLARHILATGNPVYGRAVIKYAGQRDLWADEQRALGGGVRAQTLGTDSQGGFAVPFQLDPTLILTSDGAVNPLRQISRVERITGKKWQGVSSAGVTARYEGTDETPEAANTNLVLAQPEVETVIADCFVPFSISLELAWGALQSELARVVQDAKDRLEADKFINGDGNGEPHGLIATMNPSSNVFMGSAFAADDIFNLETGTNGLPPRFRARASFLANKTIFSKIRLFSAGSNIGEGNIWVRGLATDRPPELIGYPAYEASGMADSVAGEDILVLGDFNNFLIADRIGLTIEVVQHVFGSHQRPTNQRGVYAYWMNNTLILTDNAFRKLRGTSGS